MDNNMEFERNRQKMKLKELNGMNTLNEETNELMILLDEFLKTTSPESIRNIIEESDKEDAIIEKVLGESKALPLAAIYKLLPFIEVLTDKVLKDTSDKATRSLLAHACDDLATYSHGLVKEGTPIKSDGMFILSEDDADTLDKESLISKWEVCFTGITGQIKEDLKEKDNIKLCGHCYHLWDLSNISAIYF